jgi:chromosome segregation ATPase
MLLGKKSKLDKKADWALVVEKPADEISRYRATDKISQAFQLTNDEARDLMDNTPLILLDELSHETAAYIENYFSNVKVECFVTTDTLTKRKCFRAVWPEGPNLGSLLGKIDSNGHDLIERQSQEPVPVTKKEISPLLSEAPRLLPESSIRKDEEISQLKALSLDLQKENEILRSEMERIDQGARKSERDRYRAQIEKLESGHLELDEVKNQLDHFRSEYDRVQHLLRERDQEVAKMNQETGIAATSAQKVQDENLLLVQKINELEKRQTQRNEFLESEAGRKDDELMKVSAELTGLRKAYEGSQEKARVTELLLQNLKGESSRREKSFIGFQTAESSYIAKIQELERAIKARQIAWESRAVHDAEVKSHELEKQLQELQLKYRDAQSQLSTAQSNTSQLHSELERSEASLDSAREEHNSLMGRIIDLEQRLKAKKIAWESRSVQEARAKIAELEPELTHYRLAHDTSKTALEKVEAEARMLRSKSTETQVLLEKTRTDGERARIELNDSRLQLSQALQEGHDLKRLVSESQTSSLKIKDECERLRKDLGGERDALLVSLEEWKKKTHDWNAAHDELAKENEFLRTSQAEELDTLKVRNREITAQLAQAQRQVRDFATQAEQQELIQKREKISSELTEREFRLKSLVERQQSLEEELRTKEEELKSALSDQEEVEREIVKAKQTQKYILEQTKQKGRVAVGRKKHLKDKKLSSQSPDESHLKHADE